MGSLREAALFGLLLQGCVAPEASTESVLADPSSDAPVAELTSPAEAPDLDSDPDVVRIELVAAPHLLELGDHTLEGYAYNGQVPGPTLRAEVGQILEVELQNALDDATTLHWHGVHLPWEMDGATWLRDPVGPGESFTYRFELTQPGTFWYHPHFDTEHQVDRGLYGVLVVEDPEAPQIEDLVLVFDDFGEPEQFEADQHQIDLTTLSWRVNGLAQPVLRPPEATVVRARLLNASNSGYLALQDQRVLGRDQGPLPSMEQTDLVLAPGDRAEVVWTLAGHHEVAATPFTASGGAALGDLLPLFGVEAPAGSPVEPSWPDLDLPPTDDPGHTDVIYVFNGDPRTGWSINGEQFPEISIETLYVGDEAVIEVRNVSAARHPFHLHGHAFEVLSVDGEPPAQRTLEDTVDIGIRQTFRLLLQPVEPGEWMAHCHILPHADQGMMTVLRIAAE